ncbi:MAG: hypothetical protein GC137_00260 [Alphaproteobacteria bacterium]|nr:hypothetical protein [Alphaproteobacteria bacterium]
MRSDTVKQALNDLPSMDNEQIDILCSMRDDADSIRKWINDCILRQHIKKIGTDRLSAETRTLIKVKSYDAYIGLSLGIHRDMQDTADALLSDIKLDKTGT